VRVGSDVAIPRLVSRTYPLYPADALAANIQGTVFIEAIVDLEGSVVGARVTRRVWPSIDAAALECVRQWKYAPSQLNGQPVSVMLTMTVNFSAAAPQPQPAAFGR
jgi:TonB family protein